MFVLHYGPRAQWHLDWALLQALAQFDSLNAAFEFDTSWGYPAENPLRFGIEEEGAYGPWGEPDTDMGQPLTRYRCPLEWMSKLAQDGCGVWNYPDW